MPSGFSSATWKRCQHSNADATQCRPAILGSESHRQSLPPKLPGCGCGSRVDHLLDARAPILGWRAFFLLSTPDNKLIPHCPAYSAANRATMTIDTKWQPPNEPQHEAWYSASRATIPHGATTRRPGGLSTERWAKPNPTSWHHKKSGAEHSIQRHSSSPTGLSGGCAKPIFDHAHEKSAKRQGDRGLMLRAHYRATCPLSISTRGASSPTTT